MEHAVSITVTGSQGEPKEVGGGIELSGDIPSQVIQLKKIQPDISEKTYF